MLAWEEYVELRNLKERGWSISAIARHTGLDRKTIRRYLRDPDARPGERQQVPKLLDPFARYIDARLEDNEHIDATVVLRELRKLGACATRRRPKWWPRCTPRTSRARGPSAFACTPARHCS